MNQDQAIQERAQQEDRAWQDTRLRALPGQNCLPPAAALCSSNGGVVNEATHSEHCEYLHQAALKANSINKSLSKPTASTDGSSLNIQR